MLLFHGSSELFEAFSLANAGRTDRASNGALGIWVSDRADIAARFGDYLYSIEIGSPREKVVTVRTLARWHDEVPDDPDEAVDFYDRIRCEAIGQGYDLISVEERDGSRPTRIILDPERIRIVSVEDLSPAPTP